MGDPCTKKARQGPLVNPIGQLLAAMRSSRSDAITKYDRMYVRHAFLNLEAFEANLYYVLMFLVFQHCFTGVLPVFHQWYNSITQMLHQHFNSVSTVFHQCFTSVSPVFH